MTSKTRIQVIGHGCNQPATVGGFSATDLAKTINKFRDNKAITQINILGCMSRKSNKEPPPYLVDFIKHYKQKDTTVTIRSALVNIDYDGHKLIGNLVVNEMIL